MYGCEQNNNFSPSLPLPLLSYHAHIIVTSVMPPKNRSSAHRDASVEFEFESANGIGAVSIGSNNQTNGFTQGIANSNTQLSQGMRRIHSSPAIAAPVGKSTPSQ
jgi:hypothetical protein